MSILVQKPLLDPEDSYWNTVKFDHSELELVQIDKLLLVAAERVQQKEKMSVYKTYISRFVVGNEIDRKLNDACFFNVGS